MTCLPQKSNLKLRILFRCDSSNEIGTGHVSRCLVLANELRDRGHVCEFMCRSLPGNVCDRIEKKGFKLYLTEDGYYKFLGNYDVVVVDHYKLDASWEVPMKNFGTTKVVVIEDLINRFHNCNILIDYNAKNFLDHCTCSYDLCLRGRDYALVSPVYRALRRVRTNRKADLDVFISFGGVDPTKETEKVIQGILDADYPTSRLHVVTNFLNHYDLIHKFSRFNNVYFYVGQMTTLAALMHTCDIAFGPASVTLWEQMANGLPSVCTVTADNQKRSAEALFDSGGIVSMGEGERVVAEDYADIFWRLKVVNNLTKMSKAAMKAVDGLGVYRIADSIEGVCNE